MSANERKDWGDNGITPERIERTRAKLLRNAEIMETNAAKYAECGGALAVLKKSDGKKITRRLFDSLAVAWGAERIESQWGGGHYWRGLEWEDDTLISRHFNVIIKAEKCGWRMELPIKHDGAHNLDADTTIAEWGKLAAQWREWARGNRAAAGCVDFAAAEYNAIWARARAALAEIEKRCKWSGLVSAEITVLCAFEGDVYDRLNPFRWHENKAIED